MSDREAELLATVERQRLFILQLAEHLAIASFELGRAAEMRECECVEVDYWRRDRRS